MLAEWSPRTPFADGVASVVYTIIILTIPVLFIIFATRWACEDAEERGMSKIVSVILVVLFFPLGWVFWLIMRPKKKAFICPCNLEWSSPPPLPFVCVSFFIIIYRT